MKSAVNAIASTHYSELFDADQSLKTYHPALHTMQELSDQVAPLAPTAITKLEVYKECHRLADDLYSLTGSTRVKNQVLRVGDMLLTRILNGRGEDVQVNQ